VSRERLELGRWGERVAARKLLAAGYAVIVQNYRCPAGEMDIVARDGDNWVFVEVKTRRGNRYGPPEEAITHEKARRLLRVAEHFLQERGLEDTDWRIDVIAVELDARGHLLRVEQTPNAVSGW
jgi:putative endonuclease